MNSTFNLKTIFSLFGWPDEHKHEGAPPVGSKIHMKFGSGPGEFERANKNLGGIRVKPTSQTVRYDLYYYFDGAEDCLALTKEKIKAETRARR